MTVFNKALAETFRCPDDLCSFLVNDELSDQAGFFQLGKDTVGYGRYKNGTHYSASAPLDISEWVTEKDGMAVLPFDPNEVITNLLWEKYFNPSPSLINDLVYRAYYAMRPLLPVSVRRHLQRVRLNASRNAKFPHWPLDYTTDRLLDKLLALSLKTKGREDTAFISFWPDGVQSCAIMTHDVETDTGLRFCPTLMDIDDSYGIKSSFQLVPEERYVVTETVLNSFRERGFEVNVHDFNHDGHLYSDREQFQYRSQKINEYARTFKASGFRSGAMYRNMDWYDAFEFDYDMSVPTVGHLEAQSGGCCTLRPYFINNIVELPLTTTQDYSLFHILGQYSIDLWKQQIDAIVERSGLVSFIVHPDYIIERKAQDTYKALLAYLAQLRDEGKLKICLPGQVAQWWKQRSKAYLEYQNNKWEVVAPAGDGFSVSQAHVDEAGDLRYA